MAQAGFDKSLIKRLYLQKCGQGLKKPTWDGIKYPRAK
jgi:hypothetical protein